MPPAAALAPSDLLARLKGIVGSSHVLTADAATRRYRSGFRYGGGDVLAVVRPSSLTQLWRTLEACHAAGTVILCQAVNTGLTGGSTPMEGGYDRPVVLINMLRLTRLDLLQRGEQVLAQPGVTLEQLERTLKPLGREPHSVIGSSCIGASVTGGICNNSGGSLIRRGPAFTQFSLHARIDEDGQLRLVNHLGIALGDYPEQILATLEDGRFARDDLPSEPGRMASDREYAQHVRDIDSSEPARYNADPRRLYEASGSAGKIAVFALRLDTFAADSDTRVFYIGTNQPQDLAGLRRHMLAHFASLPVAAERLLIRGGTTSVGLAAASIANAHGATVGATSRSIDGEAAVRAAGASYFFLDDGAIAPTVHAAWPSGAHKVLELVRTTTLIDSLQATAESGTVCMAGMVGDQWSLQHFAPMDSIPTGVSLTTYSGEVADFMALPLQKLIDQVEVGGMPIRLGRTFRLDEIVQAHAGMERTSARGKLVVLAS